MLQGQPVRLPSSSPQPVSHSPAEEVWKSNAAWCSLECSLALILLVLQPLQLLLPLLTLLHRLLDPALVSIL